MKTTIARAPIEIDQSYEEQVTGLSTLQGNVNDYAIEPRPQPVAQAKATLVLPERREAGGISPQEQALLAQSHQVVGSLMQGQRHEYVVSHDTAETIAKASLRYSLAYAGVAVPITVGLLLIVYLFRGGDLGGYFFSGLILWGAIVAVVLYYNRGQGLHHSSTGIAHHEIDSRERIALGLMDRHLALLKYKWEMERRGDGSR